MIRATLFATSAILAVSLSAACAQDSSQSLELEIETLVAGELVAEQIVVQVDTFALGAAEVRTDSLSRTIEIPVVRMRATGSSPAEPIFWLGGGPGQTNLRTFDYDYFVDRHDHVMVGYRGVDGPVSLDCAEVAETLKDSDDVLDPQTLDNVGEAFLECLDRLEDSGVDIEGYSILEVVHDIELARKSLGYDKILILAESFGTRLAQLYTTVYPENVTRVVMIGAQPPGGMVWDPDQSDAMIERYGELWSADPELVDRHPDLAEAVGSVNQNMPKRWFFMPIHPGNVKASAFPMLFHRESAAKVFDTYVAAANGDASGLWLISIVAPFIFPNVVNWGENASKAVSADHEPGRDYVSELLPDDAIIGAPLGAFLWAPAALWPIERIPDEYWAPRESNLPTLFLSGSLDLTTPPQNVTSDLMPLMPNATHVVLAEMGHILDLWRERPETTHRILTSFIETGAVDTSTVEYVPMDFSVQWGFPFLAKLTVAAVVLIPLLLVLGIWFFVRRTRRRRRRQTR